MFGLLKSSLFIHLSLASDNKAPFPPSEDLPRLAPMQIHKMPSPSEDCSKKTTRGSAVAVDYTGWLLKDATMFDTSSKRDPLTLTLGAAQVIPGWEEGLMDACLGEKRLLIIPAGKAYGERGIPGVIPGDATLAFEVHVVAIDNTKEDL